MDLNKLTDKAQEAVLAAQALANAEGRGLIQPAHLLLALLRRRRAAVLTQRKSLLCIYTVK